MVHLGPLPGAPRWGGSFSPIIERALADAEALASGGVDGVIVENYGDAPFHPDTLPPETIAALAVCVAEVARTTDLPVGVNALRNDARGALAVAVAAGARFIRINVHTGAQLADQGWLTGRAHETLRERARLRADVAILADVFVKHAAPPAGMSIEQAARDAWHRGLADGLIVSGEGTGLETDLARVRAVKAAVPEAPVWIGSGITTVNARASLEVADGAIVGSALQEGGVAGGAVDPARVRALVEAARR